jgi:molybdate transport system ATP-binding protein
VLRARLLHRLGEFRLDCELAAAPGETLVLVGASASGKTTALRLLAGLLRPDEGRISMGEELWCDRATGAWIPASARPVGYVAQDYALFPHLSVRQNIGFGPAALGLGRAEVMRRTDAMLERFGLTALAGRRPGALSGGQQQRVALARALALEPALLLLDEPLAALDVETRHTVRTELTRLLHGLDCVTVFVTHEPLEALLFGDRIVVLEHGQVAQVGDRETLLRQPRSRYVASLLGLNLLPGRVTHRGPGDEVTLETLRGPVTVLQAARGDQLFVVVPPDQVTLSVEPPAASARNVFVGVVEAVLPEPPFGERVRVVIGPAPPLVAEITAAAAATLRLVAGSPVYATFKATSIAAYA